ncbi:MAG: pitrilysin family protein [Victivallaceae bacterium]|nr:pitrilysin family protein [Victivallaceae bacterium]
MTEFQYNLETLNFPNGARLAVLPLDGPTVALQLAVATGSVCEEEYTGCGLSHFLEHMLFQGTMNYPGTAVSDVVSDLGGDNNAFTGYYQTVYHMTLPAAHCRRGLDILADMAINPTFPEEKFASEKEVICHERAMRQDRPENVLFENFFSTVFQNHPARYPIIGYLDKIQTVTREMMMDYFNRRYRPHLCFFIVVGPITAGGIYEALAPKLANWERGSLKPLVLPTEPEARNFRTSIGYFNDPVSRLAVGFRIPGAGDRITPALEMLSGIVAESASSRLVRELHRERELALDVGGAIYPMPGDGAMYFSAAATPKKYGAMREAMLNTIDDVCRNGVTAAELEREKNQQTAMTLREMRSPEDIAMQISAAISKYSMPLSPDTLLRSYQEVTLDDVNSAAAEFLRRECLCAVDLLSGRAMKRTTRKSGNESAAPQVCDTGKLRAVTAPSPRVPLTELAILLPGGAGFETRSNTGISRLLTELFACSTADFRDEDELSEFLDLYAIESSFHCGFASVMCLFSCPSEFQDKMFFAAESILLRPRLTKRIFNRERQNLIEYVSSKALDPMQRALDECRRLLYGDTHPGGFPRLGAPENLEKITVQEMTDFYASLFDPRRVTIGLGGRFDEIAAKKFFNALASGAKWNDKGIADPPPPHFTATLRHSDIILPRSQSAAACALPCCSNFSEDRIVFDLLQQAENGLGSHLFKTVREYNSLAYSTGALSYRNFYDGCFILYAMTSPARRGEALKLLLAESRRLGTDGLSNAEFEAARSSAITECAEENAAADTRVRNTVLDRYYNQPLLTAEEQIAKYRALRCSDVNAVLKKYFSTTPPVTVFAGPEA